MISFAVKGKAKFFERVIVEGSGLIALLLALSSYGIKLFQALSICLVNNKIQITAIPKGEQISKTDWPNRHFFIIIFFSFILAHVSLLSGDTMVEKNKTKNQGSWTVRIRDALNSPPQILPHLLYIWMTLITSGITSLCIFLFCIMKGKKYKYNSQR